MVSQGAIRDLEKIKYEGVLLKVYVFMKKNSSHGLGGNNKVI